MKYYVKTKHPITGERIEAVPTGKTFTEESTGERLVEAMVITPKSNLRKIWIRRSQILKE